jgi:hypothetical protein
MGAGNNSQSQSEKMVASAPPKMGSRITGGSKLMGDAEKAFSAHVNDIGILDIVQIPDNFEDFDTESETLSDKLRKIDAYGDNGQGCSKGMEGEVNKQMWFFENEQVPIDPISIYGGK